MDTKIFLVVVLLGACGPRSDPLAPNGDPKCDADQLSKLTTEYSLELTAVCKDYDDLESCPEEKRGSVDKKYEQLFKTWAECE